MKITLWMIILSHDGIDEYYIDMALRAVLPYVDAIFIQDQGSTDRTREVIDETMEKYSKIPYAINVQDHGYQRFDPAYDEPYFRTLALQMAESTFPQNNWLLQCDADDYYTPFFFETLKRMDEAGELKAYNGIRQASDRFITPVYRAQQGANSLGIRQEVNGFSYLDPHTRLWRYGLGCKYVQNPAFKDSSEFPFLHCVLQPEPFPMYWLPGLCVIHLHRMFGPKAWAFWEEGGDKFERITPFNPRRQAPKWFGDMVNMGDAIYTPYQWPDFIMKKWGKWGRYD